MKSIIIVFVGLLFVNKVSYCQVVDEQETVLTLYAKYTEGQTYLDDGNFSAAIPVFQELLKKDPENANYCFKLGFSYLNTLADNKKALEYLEKASLSISKKFKESSTEKNAPIETLFYLGKAFHVNNMFDNAINSFNSMLPMLSRTDSILMKEIRQNISYSVNAKEFIKKPVQITIENLGAVINTQYSEHSPVFSADESVLIFTSKREGNTGGLLTLNGQFYEDIYISNKENGKWSAPKSISASINTSGHEASIGLSVDGQTLLIYKDDDGDGNIYISELNGDNWSIPKKLGNMINTKYRESHASLSADGKSLYFASSRPGGYGGMDIYVSRLLPNGEFSEAQNLGSKVNSPFDEDGPFIHPDGQTLFFSSQGHNSMGGFDIFMATMEEGTILVTDIVNMGYPINTTGDDVFYNPTPDGNRAYYASFREGGKGQNDIFLITLSGDNEKLLTVITGILTVNDNPSADASITVTDKETQEIVGSYIPNAKSGKFLFVLQADRKYVFEFDGGNGMIKEMEYPLSRDSTYAKIQRAINLNRINLGKSIPQASIHGIVADELTAMPLSAEIEVFDIQLNALIGKYLTESVNGSFDFSLAAGKAYGINVKSTDYLFYSDQIDISNLQENKDITKNVLLKKVAISTKIILKNIFFDFNKSTLRKESINELKYLTDLLITQYPNMKIEISGHTDNMGKQNFNINLSTNRAKAVVEYLISAGVAKDRLTYIGYGFSEPIAGNDTQEGRQLNRRVEFKIVSN
jgi:outer membrane protein OmpA-like peptidoglycan-associated protein/Tol biopolymer transport system component